MASQKKSSLSDLLSSRTDYINLIVFLVVFSALILFIIRPSLVTAFSIAKKQQELVELNDQYEIAITQIVNLQTDLVRVRDALPLVDEAIPKQPNVAEVISQITEAADEAGVSISQVQLATQPLIYDNEKQEVLPIEITLEIDSSFPNIVIFINKLYAHRRIKFASNLEVLKSTTLDASQSAILKTRVELLAYYM